jgi:hypothetical protein
MTEQWGDLWIVAQRGVLCITTNGYVNRNGEEKKVTSNVRAQ